MNSCRALPRSAPVRRPRDDAPQFESDPEEFIEQLRQPRREIFDAEYVHLYR